MKLGKLFINIKVNIIIIADLNTALKDIDNLLFDNVHPTDEGFKIMGKFWTDVIIKYLNETFNVV